MKVLYVGTYTVKMPFVDGHGKGVYAFKLDVKDNNINGEELGCWEAGINPSFLVLTHNKKFLFSASEINSNQDYIRAFNIQKDGSLKAQGEYGTKGSSPCFLETDKSDEHLLVANYMSGSVITFRISADGVPSESSFHQWAGSSGVVPDRQEGPHAHCITLDNTESYVYAADLGADKVWIYQFVREKEILIPTKTQPFVSFPPGSGPRHIAFHPDGGFLFVVGELDSTVNCCKIASDGSLELTQTIPGLPENFKGTNTSADIHMTPNGKFLYLSNRGHDSIAMYRFVEDRLQLIDYVSTRGKSPRNFLITPDGRYCLVANQDSDSIVAFGIDQDTGILRHTGDTIPCPSPVCLKLVDLPPPHDGHNSE